MERSQSGHIPQKLISFSSSKKLRETDRNFSLGSIRLEDRTNSTTTDKPDTIDEEEEEEGESGDGDGHGDKSEEKENAESCTTDEVDNKAAIAEESPRADDLNTISADIDRFLTSLLPSHEREPLPPLPESKIDMFVDLVEQEIVKYESGTEKLVPEHHHRDDDEPSFLDSINLLSKMTSAFAPFSSSDPKYMDAMNQAGSVLHHAMSFLEDEFYALLEESSTKKPDQGGSTGGRTRRPPSFSRSMHHEQQQQLSPSSSSAVAATDHHGPADAYPPPEIIARFRAIANAMISAGYGTECSQVFSAVRSNAFCAAMSDLGFEKIAIDDVQRMPWDALEAESTKWTKAFRHAMTTSLPLERDLCHTVFSAHRTTASIFDRLAHAAVLSFLNFPEALAMTKRSAEKLFKTLDLYEALRDTIPKIDTLLFPEEEELAADLGSEMSSVQSRLGEAAVAIFCDLESSIKSDAGKNTVPGGAVHPLTRYVMNYLKFSCEYIGTLEQIFKDHKQASSSSSPSRAAAVDSDQASSSAAAAAANAGGGFNQDSSSVVNNQTPFAVQLSHVMELLQANLDSKAKLYKDLALSNIFLMNNGRYIVQKIKGSGEIKKVLGDNWYRRRSSELRQYHNNYKRETWSKVLTCFKEEGLTVKGSVYKPNLKERFKSFNAMFEEIHKTQSAWIVSDEQLQSELRVSVSAVVVPAYRSFLGRFSQYLDAGRQTEKYIKFGPEDLETYIDELFDGNATSSMLTKRR